MHKEALRREISQQEISRQEIFDKEILHKRDIFYLPKRNPASHKGSYGKCLIIAGAEGMAGAAYFAALSAYRSGAGLIKLCTARENQGILQSLIPEAILLSFPKGEKDFANFEKAMEWADFLLFGPGMGTEEESKRLLQRVLERGKVPLLIDADGLNLLSSNSVLQALSKDYGRDKLLFLTPHLMEFSRLTGLELREIEKRGEEIAKSFGKEYHCVLLLKSHKTSVISPEGELFYRREKSCGALSKGGSGDVFAGSLAGIFLVLEEERRRNAVLALEERKQTPLLALEEEKRENSALALEEERRENSALTLEDERRESSALALEEQRKVLKEKSEQGCIAALLACEAQILAGELAKEEWGEHGVLARDIANMMGKALTVLEEQGFRLRRQEQ